MNGSEENQTNNNNSFAVPDNAGIGQQVPETAPSFTSSEPYLPPEPKKSAKKPLIVALIIVVVLALIGGGVYFYLTTQKQQASDQQSEDKKAENEGSKEQTYICSTNIVPQIVSEVNDKLDSGEITTSDVPAYYAKIYSQAIDQDLRARRVCILNLLPEVDSILVKRNDLQSELNLLISVDYNNLDDGEFTLVEYTQYFYYKKILELAIKLDNQKIIEEYQPLYDDTKAAWDEVEQKKAQAIQGNDVVMGETK